jgi:type VI secretion system secreted protein Hcp
MAIDVYLQIDGIKGESTDSTHKDWIECTSVDFGVLQPRSATASSSGGHTAERCEHKDIVVSKFADLATPLLLEQCSMGKTISKAKLEFLRADADGKRVTYFTIELENLIISSVTPKVAAGNIMTETLSIKYAQVKWKYVQQRISGGQGGNTAGGWNLSTNVKA